MTAEETKKTIILKGIGVSPGVATGKVYLFDPHDAQVALYKLEKSSMVAREIKRFRAALKASEEQLKTLDARMGEEGGRDLVYVIDVHRMILRDRSFINHILARIRESEVNAEWAVRMTVDHYRETFEKVEDEYLRERFGDIRYVGQLIVRNLVGAQQKAVTPLGEHVIVIAPDLSPADTAQLMIDKVLGFATNMGSRTSHTAIVARSIEIPAVVGLETITRHVRTNDDIIIDGSSGMVIINPDPEVLHRYEEKQRLYLDARESYIKTACLPAVTQDGVKISIGGNIEFAEEIPTAITHGAEGIGLYRTEFVYNRDNLPTEEDHYEIYRRIVSAHGLGWSTIRTFDLGGDKFFSSLKLARETNPQMGLRAIRFCLKEVDLFRIQLRAILRAAALGNVRILFPMISGIEEIREVKKLLHDVSEDLRREGIPRGEKVDIGAMIEVPSAVIMADALAREVDFFSIGTNDLIQYSLAIDRINERVTYLYEPLHPAVLRLIKQVVDAGHRAGIPVAMCGEMAGDPMYALVLLGLELDELSMNPLAIPAMKSILRGSSRREAKELLAKVLTMTSGAQIRAYVEKVMEERFPEEFAEDAT